MASTLAEQIAIEKVGPLEYVSKFLPDRMGNVALIAYGGCALGVAVHAAVVTTPPGFYLYSAMGYYLGPTSIEQKLTAKVEEIRNTRSFVTRRVRISQTLATGETRNCLELIADFHVKESALLTYSTKPTVPYTSWQDCPTWEEIQEQQVDSGIISEEKAQSFQKMFNLAARLYNRRPCPEGISAQNLMGATKATKTTQDDLPIFSKTSSEWVQSKHKLTTVGEQMAGVAFMMDGGLSFLPLTHSHRFLEDSSACSSLDFALRVFCPDLDMNEWYFKELMTIAGANGRTYSEGKMWDQKGNLVASMTQQCILRVKTKL